MVSHVSSLAFNGIEIVDIDIQISITPGIPRFIIVGLADKTIGESRERVAAALSSMGLAIPARKIIVNLAPADLTKEGSHFDLAIAVAILVATKILSDDEIGNYLVLGELSLDGHILPVNGVLPAAIGATARNKGIICPYQNGSEAAWSGNKNILAPKSIIELINHFKGSQLLVDPQPTLGDTDVTYPDFKDIKGQKVAKRAIEITAAGNHNLLMSGPPGAGKSMLAQRLPGIVPNLSSKEILECSAVYSVAGKIKDGILKRTIPFRSPHHSCTIAVMIGGGTGSKIKPGEISLAHNGILFLDELAEFSSKVLDGLRQPMELKKVLISRSGTQITFPSNFQLVAATNPCKCGYLFDEGKVCSKAPLCGTQYQSKISGPMLDRFDLHIEVGNSDQDYSYGEIFSQVSEESSDIISKRVLNARRIQLKRYQGYDIRFNNELDGQMIIDYAVPQNDALDMLNQVAKNFRISMRGYNKILKVARTIADLDAIKIIRREHIAEALSYRQMF